MGPADDEVLRLSEELVVEPRRLSRRARVVLVGVLALVSTVLLTGSQSTGCTSATGTSATGTSGPSARPWLGAGDPAVRDLHFTALDRHRTRADAAPADVLPADVARTTRRLGDTGGVAIYLAGGRGFSCLGVDARPAQQVVTGECLLDATVVNQGLSALVSPDGPAVLGVGPFPVGGGEEPVLVVAVPDHARLLTASATERVAAYPNAVVLRPHGQEVLLQLGDQAPVSVYRPTDETTFPATC